MDSLRVKAQTLVERQENPEGGVELGDEPDEDDSVLSPPPSMATDASIALENIDTDLWVGKLKVWMELWRYNDRTKGTYLTDNKRWIAMDEVNPSKITPAGENPYLTIADLFPPKQQNRGRAEPEAPHWREGDDRRMVLNLRELGQEVLGAKKEYAVDRAEVAWTRLKGEFALYTCKGQRGALFGLFVMWTRLFFVFVCNVSRAWTYFFGG